MLYHLSYLTQTKQIAEERTAEGRKHVDRVTMADRIMRVKVRDFTRNHEPSAAVYFGR